MAAPTQLVDAFAHAAPSPNITFPIPENQGSPGSGTASFDLGFPPETMQNPAAGGVPPFGQDMNGILFMISSVVAFLNQGNTFQYSSGFATSIGGYAPGSIVQSARTDSPGSGYWLNTVANNTSDPDASTSSGWVPISNYGYTTVDASSAVGGVITLNAQQAARSAVIVTGTLAGNLSVVFPNWLDSWLVINAATVGAFALTARTAAGTGVVIPPGGFAQPSGIYGDGTNIYSSVTPLTVPISQSPTPLTLVERTNAGYVLAEYFNQASAIENVPSPDAVFVESGNDGFLRKMAIGALTQAAAIANNGVGLPGFIDFVNPNGGNGVKLKWGQFTCINGTVPVAFPSPFPNALYCVFVQWAYGTPDVGWVVSGASFTKNGFSYTNGNSGACFYLAIGS